MYKVGDEYRFAGNFSAKLIDPNSDRVLWEKIEYLTAFADGIVSE